MKKQLLILFILLTASQLIAQIDKKLDLYKTILTKDSLLFNVGFNTCNINQFENLLSDKFEFFHDIEGISYKREFINNFQKYLCSNPTTFQARRELLNESTQVFPLYKKEKLYGAIQIGVHQFFEKIKNKKETFGSSANFTHVWLLENGEWKLARSLSYNHQEKLLSDKSALFDDDEEIEKWLAENNVPTLGIGIIEKGKLQQVKVFGEIAKGVPAPYNTIFNVASLTKPVTAMVALKLVSLGKWDLDEPIYKYWTDPDVANDPRNKKLTTRIILSHQTGFTNWRGNNKNKKLQFEFEPGTKYQYSGEGLEYLREALEKKFHKTLDQLADELIFKALEMNDTEFFWSKKTDESRFAIGYNNKGIAYENIKNKTANGADELLTTIEDYGVFLVSILNSEGLSKNVFDEMISKQVDTKKNKYFGLGFEIYDLGNNEIALSHGGSDNGVQTIFFIFPKSKKGILIFTNVDDGHKVYEKLLSHYLGENGKKIIEIETK
jgi:CubicO group peptidase (beta-lactamase class C family)